MLEAVLDDGWKALAPRLAEITFGSADARVGMLGLLALVSKVLQEDEDWVRLMLFEGRRPDAESGEMRVSNGYRKLKHICTELVMRGQKERLFRPEYHPQVVASMLVGAIEGIMRDRLLAEQQGPITPYSGSYLISGLAGSTDGGMSRRPESDEDDINLCHLRPSRHALNNTGQFQVNT